MYRISVSSLEAFRRYMTEASDYDTEESVIEKLKGLFEGNEKTRTGAAYHLILEGKYRIQADRSIYVSSEKDKISFLFSSEQAEAAFKFRHAHPHLSFEIPSAHIYKTLRGPVQISHRIDAIEGRIMHDFKTKFSGVQVNDYLNSSQWKFYLDSYGLEDFRYQIFEVRRFHYSENESKMNAPHSCEAIFLPAVEIQCLAYPGMHEECLALLNDFIEWVYDKDLAQYLKPANTESVFFP